jgi:lipopolysaccharide O-acetyltransferase
MKPVCIYNRAKGIINLARSYYYIKRYKLTYSGRMPRLRQGLHVLNGQYIKLGGGVHIGRDSTIECYSSYAGVKHSPHLTIGDNFSATKRLTLYCAESITIGNSVLIASDVVIMDENHGMDPTVPHYRDTPLQSKPVKIGDGVWIGEKAIILPGVEIGEKAIIGAMSVVTKSIPAYTVAVGNPCRVIKRWLEAEALWMAV